ncbi:MAG: hypothetical protein LBK76_08305 [Verrucomicrobiales bacterium]|nr:hypothetical protein [Verrucomicrobiales bacterium]
MSLRAFASKPAPKTIAPARFGLAKNHRRSSNYGGAIPTPGWRFIFMITQSAKHITQNHNGKIQNCREIRTFWILRYGFAL